MTPERKAMEIYIHLYKRIGCEAKSKQTGRYMIAEIIDTVSDYNLKDWWVEVLTQFNKL